jgi:hypothetical protein
MLTGGLGCYGLAIRRNEYQDDMALWGRGCSIDATKIAPVYVETNVHSRRDREDA